MFHFVSSQNVHILQLLTVHDVNSNFQDKHIDFYESLYSSDIDHSRSGFYDFGRDLQFAKLSDEEKLNLDGEITLEQCETIFNAFQNVKSPGNDGYTAELYKQFFSLLGQDLVNSFNAAFDIGEMSVSQQRGVNTLLPKEDSNLLLLNTDYKIASKLPRG